MPVRKMYGYKGCDKQSPIRRKANAPSFPTTPHNPKAITARGWRRHQRSQKYLENRNTRSQQSHPARNYTGTEFLKGPTQWPKKDQLAAAAPGGKSEDHRRWLLWDSSGRPGDGYGTFDAQAS